MEGRGLVHLAPVGGGNTLSVSTYSYVLVTCVFRSLLSSYGLTAHCASAPQSVYQLLMVHLIMLISKSQTRELATDAGRSTASSSTAV